MTRRHWIRCSEFEVARGHGVLVLVSIIMLQVVAEHLFHEGKFEVGEAFIQEAGIAKSESLKKPFEAMYQVLQEVKHNLAWKWQFA